MRRGRKGWTCERGFTVGYSRRCRYYEGMRLDFVIRNMKTFYFIYLHFGSSICKYLQIGMANNTFRPSGGNRDCCNALGTLRTGDSPPARGRVAGGPATSVFGSLRAILRIGGAKRGALQPLPSQRVLLGCLVDGTSSPFVGLAPWYRLFT